MTPDKFHYHEILDRAHVVECIVQDSLYSHSALTPKMKKKLEKVMVLLAEIYQMASKEEDKAK